MAKKPKVLIIVSEPEYQKAYSDALEGKAEIVLADTLEKAERLVQATQDVALIIIAPCLEGDMPDTLQLIASFRSAGYTGLMLAVSSYDAFRRQQLAKGCNYEHTKWRAEEKIEELFSQVAA